MGNTYENIRKAQSANIAACYNTQEPEIEKSGEGSRGGHVIDHTSSGIPIYEHKHYEKKFTLDKPDNNGFSKVHYSEGGEVVGKTQSGKPIYDTFNHPAHKNFTQKDHEDAEALHGKIAGKFLQNTEGEKSRKQHITQAHAHRDASQTYHPDKPEFYKGGPGSGRKIGGFSHGVSKHLMNEDQYSKGWLHHPARTPEHDTALESHLKGQGLSDKETAAYVISRHGRHVGDHLESKGSFHGSTTPKHLGEHIKDVANGEFDDDLMKKSVGENVLDNFHKSQAEKISSIYADQIEKSGEGSRGGKVIGHTKSGKPIYASPEHTHQKALEAGHHIIFHNPTTEQLKLVTAKPDHPVVAKYLAEGFKPIASAHRGPTGNYGVGQPKAHELNPERRMDFGVDDHDHIRKQSSYAVPLYQHPETGDVQMTKDRAKVPEGYKVIGGLSNFQGHSLHKIKNG